MQSKHRHCHKETHNPITMCSKAYSLYYSYYSHFNSIECFIHHDASSNSFTPTTF